MHGRVVFVGDAAHQVSPFGARGANSGIQDAENLAWKLALVLAGDAPASLIDSYDLERSAAADENIGHSTRSTDFIAPRSAQELRFRDAALALARETGFAKRMVNSGRLSVAERLRDAALDARPRAVGRQRRGSERRCPMRRSSTAPDGRCGSSTRSAARRA